MLAKCSGITLKQDEEERVKEGDASRPLKQWIAKAQVPPLLGVSQSAECQGGTGLPFLLYGCGVVASVSTDMFSPSS